MKYLLSHLMLVAALAVFVGCDNKDSGTETANQSGSGEADHDHDHGEDGHDHGEEGHDHGEEGHDHGDHGHDDHGDEEPATLASILASVEKTTAEICKAFADGKPNDAHGALHDVGHSLEALTKLAESKDGLSEEQLGKVKTSVESLFDGFGKLDGTMHGGEEVDIAEVSKALNDAMAELKKAVE